MNKTIAKIKKPLFKKPLADNEIKFLFPTLEEAINSEYFYNFDKYTIDFLNAEDDYSFGFNANLFGKEIIFEINDNGYTSSDISIYYDDIKIFHQIAKCTGGKQNIQKKIVNINGNLLVYNKTEKVFNCGCQTIGMEDALEVFKYFGEVLGYEITE